MSLTIHPNTPIIIGVGQLTESVPENLQEKASSHVDMAAKAAAIALGDAKDALLAQHIDVVATVRFFTDSHPTFRSPFGGSNNVPRSIAKRINANPKLAIYDSVGGDTPQQLVAEFAERLAKRSCEVVLLSGGEAMANSKAAQKQKITLDWTEKIEGQLEDRGTVSGKLITSTEFVHQVVLPMQYYGLMENARRLDLKQDLESYSKSMGEEFSQLSKIATNNPYAIDQKEYTAEELITPAKDNPLIIAPYTKRLMAKDRVNQGAAILMTTVGKAIALGIKQDKWVFLHSYTNVKDRVLLERNQLGHSKAMEQSLLGALARINKKQADIKHFDIYSCFPIVVSESRTILGIDKEDPRALSQTGGLPYFGGPGNNYSMHGIASLVETLRQDRGSFGLAYANGGWLSKHAVGIYSTTPTTEEWTAQDSTNLQNITDADTKFTVDPFPNGPAILETYTAHYFKGFPVKVIVVGRLKHNNQRFYASTPMGDTATVQELVKGNSLGQTIYVEADPKGNRFSFTEEGLAKHRPKVITTFKEKYKFCTVEIDGWILKVTINRPEVRNALHPPANEELEGIFNAFEKDPKLRVAILTGTGNESFSAGNDLKYMSSGNPIYIPKTGFAGLTSRTNRVKPVIAAVNGLSLGGGLEIALATDIIVAADHALFGLPEVKVGLFAGTGGIQRITRQIGLKAAMEILLTGQPIDCTKALELGLINYAVPADQLMNKAEEIANLISQASPVAVQSTMQLLNETKIYANVDDAVTAPHDVFDNLLNSDDFFEGSRAFAEKRKPKWTLKS